MNVILCINENSQLKVVGYVDDSNLGEFNKAISDLVEYEKFDLALKICLSNSLKLSEFCKDILAPIESDALINYSEEKLLEYRFCELITNFLSSYYNFTEYCKNNSKGWLGEEAFEETKTILSRLYDSNFFYQFFSRFRNYVTHFGLPIHANLSSLENNQKHRFFLIFPSVLLSSNQSWGPNFKIELERISKVSNQINLPQMFSNCPSFFSTLAKELHDYYTERISSSISLISKSLKGFDYKKHEFYLYEYSSPKIFEEALTEVKVPFQSRRIPRTTLGLLEFLYNKTTLH